MQEHGQLQPPGHPQLGLVEPLLARQILAGHEMIQTDFTHRHQARVVVPLVQLLRQDLQVGVVGLWHRQGMDAQGICSIKGMGQ